jgi:hypothetical protein
MYPANLPDKLHQQILLHLYSYHQYDPINYVNYAELSQSMSNIGHSPANFIGALAYLVSKGYIEERITNYRITSLGIDHLQALLNPPPNYQQAALVQQSKSNTIAILALLVTLIGLLIPLWGKWSKDGNRTKTNGSPSPGRTAVSPGLRAPSPKAKPAVIINLVELEVRDAGTMNEAEWRFDLATNGGKKHQLNCILLASSKSYRFTDSIYRGTPQTEVLSIEINGFENCEALAVTGRGNINLAALVDTGTQSLPIQVKGRNGSGGEFSFHLSASLNN